MSAWCLIAIFLLISIPRIFMPHYCCHFIYFIFFLLCLDVGTEAEEVGAVLVGTSSFSSSPSSPSPWSSSSSSSSSPSFAKKGDVVWRQ